MLQFFYCSIYFILLFVRFLCLFAIKSKTQIEKKKLEKYEDKTERHTTDNTTADRQTYRQSRCKRDDRQQ